MTDFRATNVISSINSKKSTKECDHCKAVEVLKHNACSNLCLADSLKEQHLVAEKIKKSISRPLPSILHSIFDTPHTDFLSRLESLEKSIEDLHEISENIPIAAKKISDLEQNTDIERKAKLLEEKLNRIEDVLNTRAAEIYDLKEQVQMLEIPKDDGVPVGDLTVYKEELKKQKKIVDEKKWANDQIKLDLIKLKKEKPVRGGRGRKEAEEEVAAVRAKNKCVEKMVERVEMFQKGINERTRLGISSIQNLQDSIMLLKQEQRALSFLQPQELVKIAKNVFASYRSMKITQENTSISVNNVLERIKVYPGLVPKVVEIQEEIDRSNRPQ